MVHEKQVTWRRNKTHELLIKGYHQSQIAQVLKISEPTVSRDVNYLREQARLNMHSHLQDRLPQEYENCMAGINQILKMSWEIATKGLGSGYSNSNLGDNSGRTSSSIIDDKTRLHALALANDCYKYKMDLVTNSIVITDAINFIQHKKVELRSMNDVKTDPDNQKNKTTNKIF